MQFLHIKEAKSCHIACCGVFGYRNLESKISEQPISEKLKEYILQNFEPVNYKGITLIVFRSKNVGEVSLYDGKKYVRHASKTVLVDN